MFVSALNDLQNGRFLEGIFRPLTNILGDWIYAVMFALVFGMLYLQTQSAIVPTVTFLLILPLVLFFVPPGATVFFYVLLALGIGGTFYQAYTHKGG